MSYNIDSHEVLHLHNLRITAKNLREFFEAMKEADDPDMQSLPEANPFSDDIEGVDFDGETAEITVVDGWEIPLEDLSWSGTWSGHSYDLLKDLLSRTLGAADVIYTWEGGDSFSGLRVRDGVVTDHEVIRTLGKVKE